MIQMNLFTKQKETHRLRKGTHGCQGEVIVRVFGKVIYTVLHLKWITQKIKNKMDNPQRPIVQPMELYLLLDLSSLVLLAE